MELGGQFLVLKFNQKLKIEKIRGHSKPAGQSHWPDDHIFGDQPIFDYYSDFILTFIFEQSIKN